MRHGVKLRPRSFRSKLEVNNGKWGFRFASSFVCLHAGGAYLGAADLLAVASREAALKWRFMPTTLNGQPTKVKGMLTFNFTLQ
ncbi:MAG: hypothetical protein ACREAB_07475 [Blastocatellia bacterium]